MTAVTFDGVTVADGDSVILRDVSLDIADGEFIGVVGPSGSGKTTLLRTVAGFTNVVGGRLLFNGADMTNVKTAKRDVGMVVQEPALLPTKTVQRNMAFPLELRRQTALEIRQRVGAEARALHLEHLLERNPGGLSRGEAQLVQIARALVRTPRVLLLDEPLASLDSTRQGHMRSELSMLQAGYGVTTLMATNDPIDAMSMPHRLVVIDDGMVVQVGTPQEVWRIPATVDAALSTGECRLLTARVSADAEGFWLTVVPRAGEPTAVPALRHRAWHPRFADHLGSDVVVGIRPSDLVVVPTGSVRATIDRFVPGASGMVQCDVGGWRLVAQGEPGGSGEVGDEVALRIDHLLVFDALSGRAIV
jgi:multiple sugar transport system ATP-binding protein